MVCKTKPALSLFSNALSFNEACDDTVTTHDVLAPYPQSHSVTTDLWRDGQAELASMKQDVSQNMPGWSVRRDYLWVLRGLSVSLPYWRKTQTAPHIFDSTNHHTAEFVAWKLNFKNELHWAANLNSKLPRRHALSVPNITTICDAKMID